MPQTRFSKQFDPDAFCTETTNDHICAHIHPYTHIHAHAPVQWISPVAFSMGLIPSAGVVLPDLSARKWWRPHHRFASAKWMWLCAPIRSRRPTKSETNKTFEWTHQRTQWTQCPLCVADIWSIKASMPRMWITTRLVCSRLNCSQNLQCAWQKLVSIEFGRFCAVFGRDQWFHTRQKMVHLIILLDFV